jgi:hypothetical protein
MAATERPAIPASEIYDTELHVADVMARADGAVPIEELVNNSLYKENAEVVLEYKDVVKQALVNAVRKTRSYVLRYEYVYDEIYDLIEDEDEAWTVENAVYGILGGYAVKIDDVIVYKIYVDEDTSENDIIVVLPDVELSERQLKMLEEIAELFATKTYYDFSNDEKRFYDATPIAAYERDEVYIVLHNLVCMWIGCDELMEEEE